MNINLFKKKSFWIIFILYQFLIINSQFFSNYYWFLSTIVFVFNVCPLYYYYLNYKNIDYIPLYYYTHIYFFLCYSISLFFPELLVGIFLYDTLINEFLRSSSENFMHQVTKLQYDFFINGLEVYVIGIIFFNLGNYLVESFIKETRKFNKNFDCTENYIDFLILGISSYFIYFIFLFTNEFDILKKIYQLKYPITYLSILSIQLFIIFKKDLNNLYKIILYLIILSIVFLEFLDGSLANSFLYLISIYLLNFIITKKIYIKVVISIFLISFVIHGFKYEYRNVIWGENNLNKGLSNYEYAKEQSTKKLDLVDKSKIFFKTYYDSLSTTDLYSIFNKEKTFMKRNLSRLTHSFQSLIVVTTLSPEKVPYWDGHSYKILITKFIPRVIWSDKPSDTFGNGFGKRYKILGENDNTTSWNMPVLNEFYVNFGTIGTIVGMFFLGMLFKFVPLVMNYRYDNYLFLILFITLYPIFYLESHLSLIFGAILQTFIFLTVYIFLYKSIFIKRILSIKK